MFRVSSPQAKRCVTELKSQVNRLEAEVDEQRTHKQIAMVENEQLRMEVETLRGATAAGVGAQIGMKEADSECKDLGPRVSEKKKKKIPVFPPLTSALSPAHSEGPGGRAALLAAQGETRRADQQPRRPHEEGGSAAVPFHSAPILYLSKTVDTCLRKYSGKSENIDSTFLLK